MESTTTLAERLHAAAAAEYAYPRAHRHDLGADGLLAIGYAYGLVCMALTCNNPDLIRPDAVRPSDSRRSRPPADMPLPNGATITPRVWRTHVYGTVCTVQVAIRRCTVA